MKEKTLYTYQQSGNCQHCRQWNTVAEEPIPTRAGKRGALKTAKEIEKPLAPRN
jgi:predicted ATP-dependent serine protease